MSSSSCALTRRARSRAKTAVFVEGIVAIPYERTSTIVDKPIRWDARESTRKIHDRYWCPTRYRIFMARNLTHIVPPPSRVRLGAPDAEESGDSLCDSLASETGKNIR